MARLTLLHINIIGLVTTLLLAIILFFVMIKPKNDDVDATAAQYSSTVAAHGTADDVTKHTADLKKTEKDAVKTEADWKVDEAYYMPTLPYTDKSDVMQTYFFEPVGKVGGVKRYGFKDLPTVYGRWITAWYDAQRNSGIARVPGTEFPIDAFSPDPNAISSINHLTFPADGKMWPVTVECKSFDEAMAHLRKFNGIQRHGMPVVSNISLQGQSPHLLLSYQLALYIIPPTGAPPIDPRIGAGRAPAGGMGMMGGMMGGPPMGMMGGMSSSPTMMGSGGMGGGQSSPALPAASPAAGTRAAGGKGD